MGILKRAIFFMSSAGWKKWSVSNFSKKRGVYLRRVLGGMTPAKMREKIDLGPFAHLPLRRVKAGLLPPALAWSLWRYQSVNLSAAPSNGLSTRPLLPILGRMIQVVVFERGLGGARGRGGGAVEVDQADGVVCLIGTVVKPLLLLAVEAAAEAKESLLCFGAPGLFALRAALR
jgi:hypothetical protein